MLRDFITERKKSNEPRCLRLTNGNGEVEGEEVFFFGGGGGAEWSPACPADHNQFTSHVVALLMNCSCKEATMFTARRLLATRETLEK